MSLQSGWPLPSSSLPFEQSTFVFSGTLGPVPPPVSESTAPPLPVIWPLSTPVPEPPAIPPAPTEPSGRVDGPASEPEVHSGGALAWRELGLQQILLQSSALPLARQLSVQLSSQSLAPLARHASMVFPLNHW